MAPKQSAGRTERNQRASAPGRGQASASTGDNEGGQVARAPTGAPTPDTETNSARNGNGPALKATPTIAKKTTDSRRNSNAERSAIAMEKMSSVMEQNTAAVLSLRSEAVQQNRAFKEFTGEFRQMWEQSRKEKNERHVALQATMKDMGLGQVNGAQDKDDVSFDKQVKAGFNFVKLHTMLEVLDPSEGFEMFDPTFGTSARPADVMLRAARLMIGEDCTDVEAKKFLQKRVPAHVKPKSGKVAKYIERAQGRAIDTVRGAFVKAFRQNLNASSPLHVSEQDIQGSDGDEEDEEADENMDDDDNGDGDINSKRGAAQQLYDSGDFKTCTEFDICWELAWYAAQRHARMIAGNMLRKLKAFRKTSVLPTLPARKKGDERKLTSIFSLALIRLKVSKFIQKTAEGDRAGMRLPHGPEWAREVVRLHNNLKLAGENNDETDVDSQSSKDDMVSGAIFFHGLDVTRVLTEAELAEMKKRGGFE